MPALTPPDRNSTGRGVLQSPPSAVVRATCFDMAQKTALLVLWDRADEAGWCWPSLPQLAAEMGCNVKTARAAVHWLAAHDLITIIEVPAGSSYYLIEPARVLAFINSSPTKSGSTKNGRATESGRVEQAWPTESGSTGSGSPTENGSPGTTGSGRVALPNQVDEGNATKETQLRKRIPPGAGEAAAEPKPRRQRQRDAPWQGQPAISDDFTARLVAKFGPVLGEERTRFEINRALTHSSAKKYNPCDLYVESWVRDEAEKFTERAVRRNGTGPPGTHGPPAPATAAATARGEGQRSGQQLSVRDKFG